MIQTGFGSGCEYDPSAIPTRIDGSGPVWELATMYPPQGSWTEEDYLSLTEETNRLIEFSEGKLEFLPMPTLTHQLLLIWLCERFRDWTRQAGEMLALPSGTRIRVADGKYREPDVIVVSKDSPKLGERFFSGADLVVEVVSDTPGDRHRDYVEKVVEYATAGIPEYWIVDPQEQKISVFILPQGAGDYAVHGVYHPGETATSNLLADFQVDVKACFDAAKQ